MMWEYKEAGRLLTYQNVGVTSAFTVVEICFAFQPRNLKKVFASFSRNLHLSILRLVERLPSASRGTPSNT